MNFLLFSDIRDDEEKFGWESLWDDDVSASLVPHLQGDIPMSEMKGNNDDNGTTVTDPGEPNKIFNDTPSSDPAKMLPLETNAGNDIVKETQSDMMRLNEEEESFEFEKIVNHRFENMTLILKVHYRTPMDQQLLLDVPWDIIKKDHSEATARYIRLCD